MRNVILLMATLGISLCAQRSAAEEILLDPQRSSVYIVYERSEAAPDTNVGATVWLQLHNNTKWAISIKTESLYIGEKVQPLTLMNGKGVLAIRSGITVSPCYDVEEIPGESLSAESDSINEEPYQRLRLGRAFTVGSSSWIPSGANVRFQIPSEHLSSGRRISIALEYEWEKGRNPEHRVLFMDINPVRSAKP
jgi:hypothetical protein